MQITPPTKRIQIEAILKMQPNHTTTVVARIPMTKSKRFTSIAGNIHLKEKQQ